MPDAATAQESALSWFESMSLDALRAERRRDPAGTHARLIEAVGDESAAQIESALAAEEGSEEGQESFFPPFDDDLPEIIFLHGILGAHMNAMVGLNRWVWLNPAELTVGVYRELLG